MMMMNRLKQIPVHVFGICMFRVLSTGSSPYPGIAAEQLCHMLKAGYRMDKPPACSDQMYAATSNLLKTFLLVNHKEGAWNSTLLTGGAICCCSREFYRMYFLLRKLERIRI